MKYLIIKFPFSSVNDNDYTLALCIHHPVTLQTALDALDADSEVFTHGIDATDGEDTIYNYTGTLTGKVKAMDDERDDIYEPVVASKLSFNMAVQTFPDWLMQYCNLRWVSVVLYKNGTPNIEMWRGYLIGQSLNMTVVNNLLSCSMVAVDEVGMAKYMPLNKNLASALHSMLIGFIMEYYHDIHFYNGFTLYGINGIGFDRYYQLLGLTQTNAMLWHRDMSVTDDDGNELSNLPHTLVVNLDKWLQDDTATWEDVFDAVFRYLGVTLCVGGWQGLSGNDAYLLTCPTDSTGGAVKQYWYTFGSGVLQVSGSLYRSMVNPMKIGADLQISMEPDKYKSVTIESEPKRWEMHKYLDDKDYPAVSDTKQVRYEWGTTNDPDHGYYEDFGWHKLIYTKPTTEEAEYVELPACTDGEGYVMARGGLLPYDDLDSCTGLDQPNGTVADSLDFITFKEGATCVKIGGGDMGGVDENKSLTQYFLILNHVWGNMWNSVNYTMQNAHYGDTPFLTFKPFAGAKPTHPSEYHYLTISMKVKFIRENMALDYSGTPLNPYKWLWKPAPTVNDSMTAIDWTSPGILLPCEDSVYPYFEDRTSVYNGACDAFAQLKFTAIIRCGDYYWNGSSWVTTQATCDVTMWSETTEVAGINKRGIRVVKAKNYYYTIASPYQGNTMVNKYNDPTMMVDCHGVSIHNAPMAGQLEMKILGQIHYINTVPETVIPESIPFILINDVEIGWSDPSEFRGKDISNENTVYMDAYSTTKEEMRRELVMASPKVHGFFDNALVFDGGKAWHNLMTVTAQGGGTEKQPEQLLALKLSNQYYSGQCFVEFSTPMLYGDNIHNVCFAVTGLTEMDGTFLPVKRDFDYTLERMRVKLQRVNHSESD